MNNKNKELENLIEKVLNQGKSRRINTINAREYLEKEKNSSTSLDTSMETLQQMVNQQSEELKQFSEKEFGFSEADYKRLEEDILADFGVSTESMPQQTILNAIDSHAAFDGVEDWMNQQIVGQTKYCHQLVNAFRRPFVLGICDEKPLNSIIITGKNGTGKRESIISITKILDQRKILKNSDIVWIDLSLYPTKDQESIFLQDLYMALMSKSQVICFLNYDQCFTIFLNVIDDLVTKGKTQLAKRYIMQKGQLTEATSGLVSDAVSTLSASGKYLILVSEKPVNQILNAFGSDFMDAIQDQITTEFITFDHMVMILNQKLVELMDRCHHQLQVDLTVADSYRNYVLNHSPAEEGIDGIVSQLDFTYRALGEIRLEKINFEHLQLELIADPELMVLFEEEKIHLQNYLKSGKNNDLELIKQELQAIIGLHEVKEYVLSLEDHFHVQQMRKQKGLKTTEISKHMIFTGNPGTGKTTIARLISHYMKSIGVLSQGQLVEVTRADLVGRYVGHTAPLTMQVMKSAIGGVLFIDEAYGLYRGKDDSFGLEAIDALVKGMEDNRDNLIVILAGYSREMSEFLTANSGLKSRFPNIIDFKDYTGEELMQIALSIAHQKEYKIQEDCILILTEYFDQIQAEQAKTSGNGRFARNLVEQAILNQSRRILKNPTNILDELILEDFQLNVDIMKGQR